MVIRNLHAIAISASLAVSPLAAFAQADGANTPAGPDASGNTNQQQIQTLQQDIHADRQNARSDRHDIRKDERDVAKDERDLNADRQQLTQDQDAMKRTEINYYADQGTLRESPDLSKAQTAQLQAQMRADAAQTQRDYRQQDQVTRDINNDQRDINGDEADIRNDKVQLSKTDADLRSDRTQLAKNQGNLRQGSNGMQLASVNSTNKLTAANKEQDELAHADVQHHGRLDPAMQHRLSAATQAKDAHRDPALKNMETLKYLRW